MITLNLISPKQKRELRLFFLYYLMKNSVGLILICIIATAIILSITRTVLRNNFAEVVDQTSLVNKNIGTFNREITQVNQLLKEVDGIQNQYVPWSNILIYFSQLSSTNIQINSLLIKPILLDKKITDNKNNSWEITIQGQAKNRDDLLIFKRNLEGSEIFSNIKSPLANILQRQDVTFELTTTINLADIKKITDSLSAKQKEIIAPALKQETSQNQETQEPKPPLINNENKEVKIIKTDIET